jgi:hypothetical protein
LRSGSFQRRNWYFTTTRGRGGIISHANELVEAAGIQIGDSVKESMAKLLANPAIFQKTATVESHVESEKSNDNKADLKKQYQTQDRWN